MIFMFFLLSKLLNYSTDGSQMQFAAVFPIAHSSWFFPTPELRSQFEVSVCGH